jgi:hypothetical protein
MTDRTDHSNKLSSNDTQVSKIIFRFSSQRAFSTWHFTPHPQSDLQTFQPKKKLRFLLTNPLIPLE